VRKVLTILSVTAFTSTLARNQAFTFWLMRKKDKNYLIHLAGKQYYCPVEVALDVIGGKWRGVIVWYLQEGPLRFSELKQRITTVSEKVLIRELRALEAAGLVTRKIYPQVPPKVEYDLSAFGKTLGPLLARVSEFGEAYAATFGQVREQGDVI
jgi:DNA-binding HxlR family transcriptional regulator